MFAGGTIRELNELEFKSQRQAMLNYSHHRKLKKPWITAKTACRTARMEWMIAEMMSITDWKRLPMADESVMAGGVTGWCKSEVDDMERKQRASVQDEARFCKNDTSAFSAREPNHSDVQACVTAPAGEWPEMCTLTLAGTGSMEQVGTLACQRITHCIASG